MRAFVLVFSLLFACCANIPAYAQKRVALVIGNGGYQNVRPLPNPGNDADAVRAALQRLNFAVIHVRDGTNERIRKALVEFGTKAKTAEMAIVYYAGHGLEISGENWLVPVDAVMKADTDVVHEGVALNSILPVVSKASSLGLVILDACRNNPFLAKMERSLTRNGRLIDINAGLGRVEPTGSVLVAYAARDGTVADDGDGSHSPFTTALLRYLEEPMEINFLFRNIRDDVIEGTNRRQEPFVYGSLSRKEIYLKMGPAKPIPIATNNPKPSGKPPIVAQGGNEFDHNGSRMRLIQQGNLKVFVYDKPRQGMIDEGVRPGTVSFKGRIDNNGTYEGTAFLFSRTCGPVPYSVVGSESLDRQTIKLVGSAPYVDPTTCEVVKRWDAEINFRAQK
jgi:hypothetical protein